MINQKLVQIILSIAILVGVTGCDFFAPHEVPPTDKVISSITQPKPESEITLSGGEKYIKKFVYLETGEVRDVLHIVNLGVEPTLSLAYSPDEPQLLSDWHKEVDGRIMFNGGFFNTEYKTTSYLKGEGVEQGALSKTGANGYTGAIVQDKDGVLTLRYLPEEPLQEVELEDIALFSQSYPTLILPGGRSGLDQMTQRKARRTVIARNKAGEVLLIFTERGSYSLSEFMNYLLDSSLDIDIAINLDGGPSTGLLIDDEAFNFEIPASILPIVFYVK